MPNGVLVDTCTLISYVDETQPQHEIARAYIQHALMMGTPLYLSSLVAAEFSRKQDLADLGLGNFVPAPFNLPDGLQSARFSQLVHRDKADSRTAVLVDVMLVAQAHRLGLAGILTGDTSTLAKYLARLNAVNATQVRAVLTTQGFDPMLLTDPAAPSLFVTSPEMVE